MNIDNTFNAKLLFKKDDKVILIPNYKEYSTSYKPLINKELTINECRWSNLGDMMVEIIDLVQQDGVQNPYLASHFKLKENE